MLKETTTFTDFFGEVKTEDNYFHLSKAELLELEMLADGGSFSDMLLAIIESKDNQKLIRLFKNLVLMAYGIRSDDGRRFIKSDKLREEFEQTAVFSEIFISLAMDAEKAAKFVTGIMPADLPSDKPQIEVPGIDELAKKSPEEIAELIRQLKNPAS